MSLDKFVGNGYDRLPMLVPFIDSYIYDELTSCIPSIASRAFGNIVKGHAVKIMACSAPLEEMFHAVSASDRRMMDINTADVTVRQYDHAEA